MEIEVVERRKQIELQEQEIARRERELEATVRKPAEAERFRLETLAEAERNAAVAQATGDAEAVRRQGEAQAEVIRLTGEAEADAIRAKGLAEAEAMRTKADAWKEYGEAAVVQQVLETLPAVAEAVAQPLARTDRIVMFGGGGDGASGPSKLTQDVTRTVAQIPEVIESLTGIDIVGSIKNIPGLNPQAARNRQKPPRRPRHRLKRRLTRRTIQSRNGDQRNDHRRRCHSEMPAQNEIRHTRARCGYLAVVSTKPPCRHSNSVRHPPSFLPTQE